MFQAETQGRTVAADPVRDDTALQISPTIQWFCHIGILRASMIHFKRHQNRRSSASFALRLSSRIGSAAMVLPCVSAWNIQVAKFLFSPDRPSLGRLGLQRPGSGKLPLVAMSLEIEAMSYLSYYDRYQTNLLIFGNNFWELLDICHTSIELTVQ